MIEPEFYRNLPPIGTTITVFSKVKSWIYGHDGTWVSERDTRTLTVTDTTRTDLLFHHGYNLSGFNIVNP